MEGDPRLGAAATDLITDPGNEVFVSSASIWEIAIKIRIGKLEADLAQLLEALPAAGLNLLDLKPAHFRVLTELPILADHRDPFDQLLIAQAMADGLTLVSDDRNITRYPVAHISCA